MSTSDLLSGIAIIVSLAVFVITIYEQYFRGPKLEVDLGAKVALTYGDTHSDIGATLSVSFSNTGARDTIVTNIVGTIANKDQTWTTELAWYAFYKPSDAGKPGESSIPWFKFDGFASPIVAVSRHTITKRIFFSSAPIDRIVPSDDYLLTVTITARPGVRRAISRSSSFTIGPNDSSELRDKCVGGPNLEFELKPYPDRAAAPDAVDQRVRGTR
jgi:hypothetical protein